eukprot:TRINITY_DN81562_c0_g1_i1.p1 TRINITY_DN81562_c0_g1~~TRINITY_DN81562_c0_g1_i1.p1  ORF type:complete len:509 (+),score=134.86 TRINITY_DN81562_c0_g1_i1:156-1682(+)
MGLCGSKTAKMDNPCIENPTATTKNVMKSGKKPLHNPKKSQNSNSSEQMKFFRKRKLIYTELVKTEEKFIQNMELMESEFIEPLKRVLDVQSIKSIFSNIISIVEVNRSLFKEMKQGFDSDDNVLIARSFIKISPFLGSYSDYVSNYYSAIEFVRSLAESNAQFATVLEKAENQNKLTLQSFLIMPVQRLCKYPLFFNDIVRNFPSTDESDSKKEFEKAKSEAERIALVINEKKRDAERNAELIKIFNRTGEKVQNLVVPTRQLMGHHNCALVSDGVSVSQRKIDAKMRKPFVSRLELFVFSDAMLIGKHRKADEDDIQNKSLPLSVVLFRKLAEVPTIKLDGVYNCVLTIMSHDEISTGRRSSVGVDKHMIRFKSPAEAKNVLKLIEDQRSSSLNVTNNLRTRADKGDRLSRRFVSKRGIGAPASLTELASMYSGKKKEESNNNNKEIRDDMSFDEDTDIEREAMATDLRGDGGLSSEVNGLSDDDSIDHLIDEYANESSSQLEDRL